MLYRAVGAREDGGGDSSTHHRKYQAMCLCVLLFPAHFPPLIFGGGWGVVAGRSLHLRIVQRALPFLVIYMVPYVPYNSQERRLKINSLNIAATISTRAHKTPTDWTAAHCVRYVRRTGVLSRVACFKTTPEQKLPGTSTHCTIVQYINAYYC